jgi:amino acid permease
LPYAFFKSGFFIGFLELVILTGVVLLIQLIVGEVALRTKGRKRLISYAEEYLGIRWKNAVTISVLLSGIGTLLVYIILGGRFLSVFIDTNPFWGSIVFFALWFFMVLFKPRSFGKAEFFIGSFVLLIIVLITLFNFGYINLDNFKFEEMNVANVLLPYGIILFAITGYSVIPEMEDILGKERRKLRSAVIWGTLIPIIIYLIFIFTIVGISGSLTSQDAISGLARALNSKTILWVGSLLGFLAIIEAALSHGVYIKETIWYDLKANKWTAWVLTGLAPLVLFLLGARNFVTIIGLVGALFFGFHAVVILLIHKKAKTSPEKSAYEICLPAFAYYLIGLLVIFGALLEIWYVI